MKGNEENRKLPDIKEKRTGRHVKTKGDEHSGTASRLSRLRDKASNQLPKDKIQRQRRASIVSRQSEDIDEHEQNIILRERVRSRTAHIAKDGEGIPTIPSASLLGRHGDSSEAKASHHGLPDDVHDRGYERKQAVINSPRTQLTTRKRIGKVSKISPKAHFRRIVRMVIDQQLHKEEAEKTKKPLGQGNKQLFFDKTLFNANQKSRGLTSVEKRVLMKMPEDRSEDDLSILKGVVDRLKCFDKYTRVVKRELSRVIDYMILNAGRYIIKQGHDGFSFYFVVSGKVQVRITDTDKVTGEKSEHAVGEMKEGSSFGELALMHNIKRTASIVCIANGSEFLRVDRHDFERVLRMSTEREWTDRLNMLRWQPKLMDFSDQEIEDLNKHCKMQEYSPGELIIGDTNTPQDTLYFVASGTCTLIRELTVVREKLRYGEEKLHLLEDMSQAARLMFPHSDLRRRRVAASRFLKPLNQFWSVGEIGKGFYFGTGENLAHTFVLAKSKVYILELRRIKFVKNGRWKLVDRMKEEFDRALPTNKELFEKYIEESRWDQYKQKLVNDIVKKRHVSNITRWDDVPWALKVNSIRAGLLQSSLQIRF